MSGQRQEKPCSAAPQPPALTRRRLRLEPDQQQGPHGGNTVLHCGQRRSACLPGGVDDGWKNMLDRIIGRNIAALVSGIVR